MLLSVVFLSGSPTAYCISSGGPSASSRAIAGVPVPTFTLQPAATIFALTNATFTTQTGKANYIWTVPGIINSDYTIVLGGIGLTSNTVTIKWLTSGSKTVTVNYSEGGIPGTVPVSSSTIVSLDTQPPSITCQASFTDEQCKYLSSYFAPPVYSDNCGVTRLTWTMTGASTVSSVSSGINIISNYPLAEGITTITYTAYDAASNSATCSFTVNAIDHKSKCTSNDFELNKFFLADENGVPIIGNCSPGNLVNAYLFVLFTPNTNANRYSLKIQYDLAQNGIHRLRTNCFFDLVSIQVNTALKLEPIVWTCGEKIQINNFYFSWQTKVQTCDCTPSQCSSIPGPIDVELPLINNFSYTPVCDLTNLIANFKGEASGGNGTYTYSWNFGTGASPASFSYGPTPLTYDNRTVVYSSPGLKTVTLTVQDGNRTVLNESSIVIVNPVPAITGTLSVCAGSTTKLTGNGYPAFANPWVSSNTNVAIVNTLGEVTGVAAGTSEITYTNTSGCIKKVTVTVNALPVCSITGINTTCPGLTYSYSSATSVANYLWSLTGNGSINGPATGSGVSVTSGLVNSSPYTLSLTLTDSNLCSSNCSKTVIKDTVPPTFIAPTIANFCVENLVDAIYNPATIDINPDRPDYFLLNKGNTILDLTGLVDNCCGTSSLTINWRIDFNGGLPASIAGTGQPSKYTSNIQFPGNGPGSADVNHRITYWVTDCNGNVSNTQVTIITVKPRPGIIKIS